MALHLVGETLDQTRSHPLAHAGRLVQLMRGIYVDAEDDIDAAVLTHANAAPTGRVAAAHLEHR